MNRERRQRPRNTTKIVVSLPKKRSWMKLKLFLVPEEEHWHREALTPLLPAYGARSRRGPCSESACGPKRQQGAAFAAFACRFCRRASRLCLTSLRSPPPLTATMSTTTAALCTCAACGEAALDHAQAPDVQRLQERGVFVPPAQSCFRHSPAAIARPFAASLYQANAATVVTITAAADTDVVPTAASMTAPSPSDEP